MPSLYERLGGVYAIAAVVDDFIDRIMDDPRLNANPKVHEAHHRVSRAGFKYLVTEQVCEATGGPQRYTGKPMSDSHAHLDITEQEWQAFLDDSRNDPCPCGSGKKYKNCCYGKAVEDDLGSAKQQPKYPIGTVAMYGPDDQTTTKIAAGVILHDGAEPIMKRWVATDVTTNQKVQQELKDFFFQHGVKSVAMSQGNMGCPHEEGDDFPHGGDCPFCPFWKGKQGSNRKD